MVSTDNTTLLARTASNYQPPILAAPDFLRGDLNSLVRPLRWRTWLSGLVAGLGWLISWYAPVSIWVGILVELLVLAGLFFPARYVSIRKKPDSTS